MRCLPVLILTSAFQDLLPSTPSLFPQHHHFFLNTITATNTMESIEEQWNPPSPPDILSDSWMNMTDAKKAVKVWILDRGESWGPLTQAGKQLNWIVGLTKLNLNLSIQSTQSHTPLHNQPTNRVIQLIDEIELIAFSF